MTIIFYLQTFRFSYIRFHIRCLISLLPTQHKTSLFFCWRNQFRKFNLAKNSTILLLKTLKHSHCCITKYVSRFEPICELLNHMKSWETSLIHCCRLILYCYSPWGPLERIFLERSFFLWERQKVFCQSLQLHLFAAEWFQQKLFRIFRFYWKMSWATLSRAAGIILKSSSDESQQNFIYNFLANARMEFYSSFISFSFWGLFWILCHKFVGNWGIESKWLFIKS